MAYDVGLGHVLKTYPFDSLQNALYLHQARLLPFGKIDLRLVARDDGLRVHPKSREKHFHLRVGRVLSFIQDDECVAERSAAHVRQRSDLDHTRLECLLHALRRHHLVERVVKRPQVRIDLRLQVSRKKTEALACFDSGTRENYSAHALAGESVNCCGNSQVSLSRSRRPDADDNVVGEDELQIDRKSTRLNSSHSQISYAVFCLKKKKKK